ncbi:hypothetical protein GCM10009765_75120 [Fodinicola feengrottensis]|uniref:Uncharacterized protein n=1 Tax=Fodinicola feengrottensis TaxID=435914 RepID=A0ABN2J0V7_9ACTN
MRSSQVRRGIVAVGLFLTTTVLLAACNLAPDDPGPGESPRAPVSGYPSVPPSSQLAGGQPWWPYVIFGALMLILIVIGVVLATGPKRRRPPRKAKR